MTIDMEQMSVRLTYKDPTVQVPQVGETYLVAAKAITRDFFVSRTALALGAGWLGLIVGRLVG